MMGTALMQACAMCAQLGMVKIQQLQVCTPLPEVWELGRLRATARFIEFRFIVRHFLPDRRANLQAERDFKAVDVVLDAVRRLETSPAKSVRLPLRDPVVSLVQGYLSLAIAAVAEHFLLRPFLCGKLPGGANKSSNRFHGLRTLHTVVIERT